MIGIYLPLPHSQMNHFRVEFLKRLTFQYEPDLNLFQAQTVPLSPHEINQLGLCFEFSPWCHGQYAVFHGFSDSAYFTRFVSSWRVTSNLAQL
jgi:hypothetical protein